MTEHCLTAVEQKLIDCGEYIWEKYGKRRIYLNNAESFKTFFGFEFSKYNSGNISHASLNGEKISNSKAAKILAEKHYFDCNAQQFVSSLALMH